MKRTLIIVALVALLALGAALSAAHLKASDASQQTQYVLTTAQNGPVRKTISATGTLQPWTTVDIKSKAGGRVNALLVDVGSPVKAGQIIARIDPTDTLLSVNTAQANISGAIAKRNQSAQTYALQVQQSAIAVNNARAALQAAQAARASAASQAGAQPSQTAAAIAQAQANLNGAVKDRQALDATNAQDRAAAQAAYDQAAANQTNAQAALARQKALVQKGYVAQQDVDAAQATYAVNAAQVQSAQEKLRTLGAQQQAALQAADARVAQEQAALQAAQAGRVDIATRQAALQQANAQVAEAQVALAQAQANIANNGIRQEDIAAANATIAANQASLTNAQTTLSQTVVRAPTDGVVLVKDVEQGTIITSGQSSVTAGTTIVTLGDITRMYVNVTVDETDIANVSPKQAVEVSFDAYPGLSFDGSVSRIDPQAVVVQNVTSFNVRVEIDNSAPTFRLLKPGMNATCQFIVDSKDDVLAVPTEAVQTDEGGNTFVLLAHGGHPAPPDPASAAPAGALIDVRTQRRPVQVGLEGDDADEITGGLKAGDKVVTQTIAPVTPSPTTGASSPFGGGTRGPGGGGGGGRGR